MAPSSQRPYRGKAALDRLYRGIVRSDVRPLLFLDFDDTICLGRPYGPHDLFQPESERPADLWEKLWHPPAVAVLRSAVEEYRAQVVLTTSWLRLMPREGFADLFFRTKLAWLDAALHPVWAAPQRRDQTRLRAIEVWLNARFEGQALVLLDDLASGSGLSGSRLAQAGRVVLCDPGVGLHEGHLPAIRRALSPGGPG